MKNQRNPVNIKRVLLNLGLNGLRKLSLKNLGNQKAYCCLLYHRVIKENYKNKIFNISTKVGESSFLMQMKIIKEQCVLVSLSEMIEIYKKGTKPDKFYVSITFDDGYEDNFTVAYPILQSLNIPATIFLTTGFIDNKKKLPWWDELEFLANNGNGKINLHWDKRKYHFDLRFQNGRLTFLHEVSCLIKKDVRQANLILKEIYSNIGCNITEHRNSFLDWPQINEMERSGLIDFAPHTINHPDMSLTDVSDYFEEVIESTERIAEETGTGTKLFAYPFGGNYRNACNLWDRFLKDNFTACFTTDFGYITANSAPFFLKRITISGKDSKSAFINKLLFPDIFNNLNRIHRIM